MLSQILQSFCVRWRMPLVWELVYVDVGLVDAPEGQVFAKVHKNKRILNTLFAQPRDFVGA